MSSSSSSATPLKPVLTMPKTGDRRYLTFGPLVIPLRIANFIFLVVTIIAQVGQNVSLPLWLSSAAVNMTAVNMKKHHGNESNSSVEFLDPSIDLATRLDLDYLDSDYMYDSFFLGNSSNSTGNNTGRHDEILTIDAYFVYSFACISFVVIFGVITLLIKIISPDRIGETEHTFPQFQLFLVGFSDAINGVMVVFAAPPYRTSPLLQSILGNFTIPMTVIMRFLMLRHRPGRKQGIAALFVFSALFVALMPSIAGIGSNHKHTSQGASGPGRVVWPLLFMLGCVPASFMNVLEEKLLKRKRADTRPNRGKINLFYFLFWTSLYQFLTAAVLFWVDIVPFYGEAGNIEKFGSQYWFGLRCFFGGAHCTPLCGVRGTMFILMYVLSYISGGLLLRHAEGATYLAVATALVTPLGSLFWALFQENPFKWHPHANWDLGFAMFSLIIMVPAIFVYNYYGPNVDDEDEPSRNLQVKSQKAQSLWSSRARESSSEKTRLLGTPPDEI